MKDKSFLQYTFTAHFLIIPSIRKGSMNGSIMHTSLITTLINKKKS